MQTPQLVLASQIRRRKKFEQSDRQDRQSKRSGLRSALAEILRNHWDSNIVADNLPIGTVHESGVLFLYMVRSSSVLYVSDRLGPSFVTSRRTRNWAMDLDIQLRTMFVEPAYLPVPP